MTDSASTPSRTRKPDRAALRGHRQSRLARWTGLALIAVVTALWLFAFVFLGWGCDYHCGDRGGRGTFLALTLFTPLAALGAGLIVASVRRDLQSGRWPARGWRSSVALLVVLGVVVAAVLATLSMAVAFEGVLWPEMTNDRPDYDTPVVFGIFAVLWGGSVWLGRTVVGSLAGLLDQWPYA